MGAYYCEQFVFDSGIVGNGAISIGNSGRILYSTGTQYRSYDGSQAPQVSAIFGQWNRISVVYSASDSLFEVNINGTKDERAYDGEYNAGLASISVNGGDTSYLAASAQLIRNVRRYDLSYQDAKAKIDELMALP